MDRPIDYSIKTFGCKVNTYDSGLLQTRFEKSGFNLSDLPSVAILNTCAVTAEATKEAIREIRRLKRNNPGTQVVVTGCAAQVDTDKFANLAGADLVIANSHKGQIEELIQKHLRGELQEKVYRSNIFRKEDLEAGGGIEQEHTRAFLKIQDGCNSFCSYCVIPFARGKSRSLDIPALVERIQELYQQGVREVVLTGVHIGDYESETTVGTKQGLEDLVEAVLDFTKMPRIRLSSLEPQEVTSRLLDLYSDKRLCPHFHMSIQSANTKVLSEMRRRYTAETVEESLREIDRRVPRVFVGMDVIVGFPGETEAEFTDTYQRLDRLPWTRLHVFPYSDRPGTKASARTDGLERSLILRRADRLRDLSQARFVSRAEAQVGAEKRLLILKKPSRGAQGLSTDYWPVKLLTEPQDGVELAGARIQGVELVGPRQEPVLIGELLSES